METAQKKAPNQAFLGRTYYDLNTRMWMFPDGSGAVPEEMREELLEAMEDRNYYGHNGLSYLLKLWEWKDRLKL